MKKLVFLLAVISLVVGSLFVYATQCSFPSVIDCDSIEEVGLIAQEWQQGICTWQEYLECKNMWWRAPEKPPEPPPQPPPEEAMAIPIMSDALFCVLTLSLLGLGVCFCKKG